MKNIIHYLTLLFISMTLGHFTLMAKESGDKESRKKERPVAADIQKINKTDVEWKKEMDDFTYYVTREAGTERAFTGKYWDHKGEGIYHCVACDLPLFASETKFRSGTGWPSFYQAVKDGYVGEIEDRSHGMVRVEVVCNRCDSHLGHLFPDGPQPTGDRFCINSASLKFKPEK